MYKEQQNKLVSEIMQDDKKYELYEQPISKKETTQTPTKFNKMSKSYENN